MKNIEDYSIIIVMYHYVRQIKGSKYPNIKGLEFENFKKQINFFSKKFNIISHNEFLEIIKSKKIPKKPSIMLTFDDGFIDHYKYVFQHLRQKRISACFYPPIQVVENKTILDVNKIHFILEKEQNRKKILKEIDNLLIKKNKKTINQLDLNKIKYLNDLYDDKETTLIKRLLQYYLPFDDRNYIINELFKKIINVSFENFAKEIYMNADHLKEMYSEGMTFGSHGYHHVYWEFLDKNKQEEELINSIKFYKKLNFNTDNISVCYPYGSYNDITIDILREKNISFALSTHVGDVNKSNIFEKYKLPRMDTNDFKVW
tara:strand:+ start:354 stop:1301 length:948 start_codon:yes stop_codon:yes gene_type:complete